MKMATEKKLMLQNKTLVNNRQRDIYTDNGLTGFHSLGTNKNKCIEMYDNI